MISKRGGRRKRRISISSDSEPDKARDIAYRLLSHRARSVCEVRVRLKKKGFSEETVDEVIMRLKDLKLLDDRDFARRMAGDLAGKRGYGRFYIAGKLKEKGINADVIAEAIEGAYSGIDEREAAVNLAIKKKRGSLSEPKERGRIGRYLQSKGYSWDIISEVLKELDDREGNKR